MSASPAGSQSASQCLDLQLLTWMLWMPPEVTVKPARRLMSESVAVQVSSVLPLALSMLR